MTLGPNDALFAACMRINEYERRPLLDVQKLWIIGRYDGFQMILGMLMKGRSGTI